MTVAKLMRWGMGLLLAVLILVAPFVYYRYVYTYTKRLREVDPGLVYRSGTMTAPGFREAVERYRIRTVLNLQDDFPDPDVFTGYFTKETIKESELCRQMGVRFAFIGPDLLDRRKVPPLRPRAIEQFLEIMDNKDNYPVLIHCKAGLHRTGCLTAVYRMEYNGWSMEQALRELKAHGFGEYCSSQANDYIYEYVTTYQPGLRFHQGAFVRKEKTQESFEAPREASPTDLIEGAETEEAPWLPFKPSPFR